MASGCSCLGEEDARALAAALLYAPTPANGLGDLPVSVPVESTDAEALIRSARALYADADFVARWSGRWDAVEAQIKRAESTTEPGRRLIEARAALEGARTAAGLPSLWQEVKDTAQERTEQLGSGLSATTALLLAVAAVLVARKF